MPRYKVVTIPVLLNSKIRPIGSLIEIPESQAKQLLDIQAIELDEVTEPHRVNDQPELETEPEIDKKKKPKGK